MKPFLSRKLNHAELRNFMNLNQLLPALTVLDGDLTAQRLPEPLLRQQTEYAGKRKLGCFAEIADDVRAGKAAKVSD